MKRISIYLFISVWFCLFIISIVWGGIYPIHLQYRPLRKFPSLQQKLGSTLGITPFEDQRSDKRYIGHYISPRKVSNYFKSDPFPLETAIVDSLSQTLSQYGVQTIPISNWDRKPESIKNIEVDSIMKVEIKRFWIGGEAIRSRTKINTWVYFVIHLGVKKEGKVFTRNVYVGKEEMVSKLTPEKIEQMVNQILTEVFDSFFSNPYEISPK